MTAAKDKPASANGSRPRRRKKEKRSLSAELAETKRRLEDITRLVSDWVWEANRDFRLTAVSPRVFEALGVHPHELLGRRLTDLGSFDWGPSTGSIDSRWRLPFRDVPFEATHWDGKRRLFHISSLPVFDLETGEFLGVRGTAEDVTKRKRVEGTLLRAKEEAEYANRVKTQFLANMSHELRTPLNSVIGFSEVVLGDPDVALGKDKHREYLNDIRGSGLHLLSVINDILDVSMIEAGEMTLAEGKADVGKMIGSCVAMVAERVAKGELALSTEVADDMPALFCDETKVRQILLNLLSNAIKFTPPKGKITVEAKLDDQGEIVLKVGDTGIGIAAENIPKVLEPFTQVEDIMTRSHEGVGLGLSLSKQLAELHDGTLTIESEVDKRTTVTVRFPPERTIHQS